MIHNVNFSQLTGLINGASAQQRHGWTDITASVLFPHIVTYLSKGLQIIRKVVVIAKFEALPPRFSGEIEGKPQNNSQNSCCLQPRFKTDTSSVQIVS
jgi:hypothetical protein